MAGLGGLGVEVSDGLGTCRLGHTNEANGITVEVPERQCFGAECEVRSEHPIAALQRFPDHDVSIKERVEPRSILRSSACP